MADAVQLRADASGAENGDDDGAADANAACEAEVEWLLDKALGLLDTPSLPRDGYYAFVCEKCAPAFGYHGYFLADQELRRRAEEIRERA